MMSIWAPCIHFVHISFQRPKQARLHCRLALNASVLRYTLCEIRREFTVRANFDHECPSSQESADCSFQSPGEAKRVFELNYMLNPVSFLLCEFQCRSPIRAQSAVKSTGAPMRGCRDRGPLRDAALLEAYHILSRAILQALKEVSSS